MQFSYYKPKPQSFPLLLRRVGGNEHMHLTIISKKRILGVICVDRIWVKLRTQWADVGAGSILEVDSVLREAQSVIFIVSATG